MVYSSTNTNWTSKSNHLQDGRHSDLVTFDKRSTSRKWIELPLHAPSSPMLRAILKTPVVCPSRMLTDRKRKKSPFFSPVSYVGQNGWDMSTSIRPSKVLKKKSKNQKKSCMQT